MSHDHDLDTDFFVQAREDANLRQRITNARWKQVLLSGRDKLLRDGRVRRLKARSLGFGVVEVTLFPLKAPEEPKP